MTRIRNAFWVVVALVVAATAATMYSRSQTPRDGRVEVYAQVVQRGEPFTATAIHWRIGVKTDDAVLHPEKATFTTPRVRVRPGTGAVAQINFVPVKSASANSQRTCRIFVNGTKVTVDDWKAGTAEGFCHQNI